MIPQSIKFSNQLLAGPPLVVFGVGVGVGVVAVVVTGVGGIQVVDLGQIEDQIAPVGFQIVGHIVAVVVVGRIVVGVMVGHIADLVVHWKKKSYFPRSVQQIGPSSPSQLKCCRKD